MNDKQLKDVYDRILRQEQLMDSFFNIGDMERVNGYFMAVQAALGRLSQEDYNRAKRL